MDDGMPFSGMIGPSEQELLDLSDKYIEERNLLKVLAIPDNHVPTHPLDWFCNISHLNFSLQKVL